MHTVGLQKTLKQSACIEGIGVHTGASVRLTLHPATANTGIVFKRIDVDQAIAYVPARWDAVANPILNTNIVNDHGIEVRTIEHLMAALYACEIDNALIELEGAEAPIMDGSAAPFIELIEKAGTTTQYALRRIIQVLKTIKVEEGERFASLSPSSAFSVECEFAFERSSSPQMQRCAFNGSPAAFKQELAAARTFGYLEDAEKLYAAGLAIGASLDNTVVFDGDRLLNPEGLRFDDECVRHKALDAVGDLYLAGGILLGRYHGHRAGHRLNNLLLRALFADAKAWRLAEAPTPQNEAWEAWQAFVTQPLPAVAVR